MATQIRTYYDNKYVSPGLAFVNPETGEPEVTRTKQASKNECDINIIVKKYLDKGQLPVLNPLPPTYGDFSDVPDFMTAFDMVKKAEDAFYALPAAARKKMDNDPAKLLDYLGNPDNFAEAEKLGLIVPRKVKEAAEAAVPAAVPAAPPSA